MIIMVVLVVVVVLRSGRVGLRARNHNLGGGGHEPEIMNGGVVRSPKI